MRAGSRSSFIPTWMILTWPPGRPWRGCASSWRRHDLWGWFPTGQNRDRLETPQKTWPAGNRPHMRAIMRMLDFARLVRLPNAFTAMADICLGALVTGALPERLVTFIFLLMASTSLYWAGMVWNDYFDLEQDKRERPFR